MANDYRILDERDIKNFQAGNKLNVTEIDNKVTYEHIGEPPSKLPLEEKVLEYGGSFDITVPSVYDSTGHVKSEITYSFKMPDKIDTSSGLTTNNFSANIPIRVNKNGNNITYSHDLLTVNESTTKLSPNDENIISFTALSAVDSCGHANQKTTYNFAIPDTSNYPTKNDFAAVAPLSVAKGENNNTVTYSHNTVNTPTETPTTVDLSYGNTFSFNALSAVDGYGHATKKTTYTFKMPAASGTLTDTELDFSSVTFAYSDQGEAAVNAGLYRHQWSHTFTNISLKSSYRYQVTVCPNVAGVEISGYDTSMVSTKLFLPGNLIFFTSSLSSFEFYVPRVYMLLPEAAAKHGNVMLADPIQVKMSYSSSSKTINLYLYSSALYVDTKFIDKIIITTY